MSKIPQGSLFFAPLEGITEEPYRLTIQELYPDWDYLATDFLRVPGVGKFPDKQYLNHFGKECMASPVHMSKTLFQILTSETALTEQTVQRISDLGFPWLDLNLGCPSTAVCGNKGGSFLLTRPEPLKLILRNIRKTFNRRFTVKMRLGYNDANSFIDLIKMIEGEGVEAITIHARTRVQLYQGKADWNYIKDAVKAVKIPVIANGDIWTVDDIHKVFDFTGCHSVMIGRGAMKRPWLAQSFRNYELTEDLNQTANRIREFIPVYLKHLSKSVELEESRLKRLKSIGRFMFDDFHNGQTRSTLMRTQEFSHYMDTIHALSI